MSDPSDPTPAPSSQPPLRCAVYARVSVADPQRRDFNSLAAQIEACEQYIASQRGRGWVLTGPAYTDNGESASTLQRPGLRALLHAMEQDTIDVVVVHRLDRLTRSLFDWSDLSPLFTILGITLVSVTQNVDTRTPNGRLALNFLTTFAEFERELIGERTRDKLSATRRHGGWQGSGTPLGYGVDHEQRLVVIEPEAALVRDIFQCYPAFDTLAEMLDWLARHRVKTKKWITRDGKARGGEPMDRSTLYRLLNNRMYIGEALFDGEWHSGIYPPIVNLDQWRAVHDKLAQRARRKGVPNVGRNLREFPLLGKFFWHDGRAYTAFKSSRRGKMHYTYYQAPATDEEKAAGLPPFNLPTDEIHQAVINHLRQQFRDPEAWILDIQERTQGDLSLDAAGIRQALKRFDEAWQVFPDATAAETLFQLLERVTLYPDGARIQINTGTLIRYINEFVALGNAVSAPQANARKTRTPYP